MAQKWVVALISTDYDLKDERKAVRTFLHKNHFEVSAFEEPAFPVQEHTYSHENCLQALKRVDLAILLIKERYGGKYYLNQNVSITQAEYEALDIPTIVLVNRKTWEERNAFKRQQKKTGKTLEEYAKAKEYDAGKIDSEELLFIEQIQKVYQTDGKSNWLNFWEDIEELTRILPEVMSSRSVTIINRILSSQIKEVRNRRTSTGLSLPLGDVFDKNYYIEPEYVTIAGKSNDSVFLTDEIGRKLEEKESCLIMGEAGVGKTTLLAKCFLQLADKSKEDPFFIPIYVWLKGMNTDNAFSVEEIIRKACENHLNKEFYPFLNLENFRFVFFLDGFDELAETITKDDLQRIYSSEIFASPVMLTSRIQYAECYLDSNEFASKFGYCISLTEWTTNTAKRYINRFCELQGKGCEFKKRIMSMLIENDDLHDVLKTPLLITILLYVIERNKMEIPETIRSRSQLFEECLDKLAGREIESKMKIKNNIPNNQDLVIHWSLLAWLVYEKRLKEEKSILIADASSRIKSILGKDAIEWPSTIYEIIFDIRSDSVFGAFHEQFLEFLVAYALAYACLNKITPYPDFLKYVMRPEINRYFRGIVSRKPNDEQQVIINNIKQLYWDCAGKDTDEDILKRVHAVYHLSRLIPNKENNEIDRMFHSENDHSVLLSLYFGAIKKGDLKREKELFDLLNKNKDYSNSNRGYHLAYYDSMYFQMSLPYCDNKAIDWEGSLRAFKRHFASHDIEHYYLRRIDLVTMRQFMEFRKNQGPMTSDILKQFERLIKHKPRESNKEFQKSVCEEFSRLRRTYEKYERLEEKNNHKRQIKK